MIVLSGATLWLVAVMLLSAAPDGASATEVIAPTLVSSFEQIGGAPGLLYYPRVFTDARGAIYVTDEGAARVIRLAGAAGPGAEADVIFGREGQGPGEMLRPHSVAVDSSGNVFVTDIQLGRINKYAADGAFVTSVVLPLVASVVIDAQDRVLAYPGRGEALLQRFSNDLGSDEPLLAKTDLLLHDSTLGVLMALDAEGRLYLLDQSGPRIDVYDREMRRIGGWEIDAPGLRATIAQRLAAAKAKAADGTARISGIQAMALSPDGDELLFAYLIKPSPEEKFTRVAVYSVDGEYRWSQDRDTRVYGAAFTAGGDLLEGDPETVRVWTSRGPQPTTTSSSN
ncbi:MAG TPA: 6-bladed beta-propeller [Acidobacteriota bacterium]